MNKLATQRSHLCQSSSQASYCPNIFSHDENNALEHHPDEECSRLVKMQIEETRFSKNKGLQPCLLKLRTISLSMGYR